MRYAPIGNEREALDRINGLGFDQYIIASYEEDWQREEGNRRLRERPTLPMPWKPFSICVA